MGDACRIRRRGQATGISVAVLMAIVAREESPPLLSSPPRAHLVARIVNGARETLLVLARLVARYLATVVRAVGSRSAQQSTSP